MLRRVPLHLNNSSTPLSDGQCKSAICLNFNTAYRLSRQGFSVFPCQPDGEQAKTPLSGLPWKSASTADGIEIVRLWVRQPWAAPAIDCGKSGLVVLDCDAKHGKQGVMAWARLIAQHEPVLAPVVLTPSGGLHVYFRQPCQGPEMGCSRGDLHPDIDVRGLGGYVLGHSAWHLCVDYGRPERHPRGSGLAVGLAQAKAERGRGRHPAACRLAYAQ